MHTDRGTTVANWWSDRILNLVAADLQESPGPKTIVNLASAEYFQAVDGIDARVISPRFESRDRQGRWKVISFTAKTARGLMAGWMIRNRVRTATALTEFDDGWAYCKEASSDQTLVFRKRD